MPKWNPAGLGPHTWIDFSDVSTLFDATSGGSVVYSGIGIARAEDKSGNGRHFTQSALGNRFTWIEAAQNGIGLARSTGNKWMTSISGASTWTFLHSTPSTIYVVVKNGDNANPVAIYSWYGTNAGSSSNTGVLFCYDDRNVITGLTDCWNVSCTKSSSGNFAYTTSDLLGTAIIPAFSNIITPNVYGIFGNFSDPANATALNRLRLSINGGAKIEGNVRTITPATWAPTYTLQIGAAGNSNLAFAGDYCEILIFDRLLNTTEQQLVEGYLADKWGLQGVLDVSHPYKTTAPQVVAIGVGDEAGWWCPTIDSVNFGTSTLADQTSHGSNATLTNMDPPNDWVEDYGDGGSLAIDLDGINDTISVPHSETLMPITGVSLSGWVKFNVSLASQIDFITIIGKESYAGNSGYFLAFRTDQPNNQLTFRINGSITVNSINWQPGTLFDDLDWHHVCATYNKSSMLLYVDGVLRASSTYNADITPNTNSIVIATRGAWRGDDWRIFRRGLSSTEVLWLSESRARREAVTTVATNRRRRAKESYGL